MPYRYSDEPAIRPGRSSRPRGKQRPSYPDAVTAMVILVDRGRITCAIEGDPRRQVVAVKARELGRKAIVVGDYVRIHGDISGTSGALARIVSIHPRECELRRTADDSDPYERAIVANVDQLGIVVALADPPPREGLIDRCLIASYDAGVSPLLLLTKSDLAAPTEIVAYYRELDLPVFILRPNSDLGPLLARLAGRRTVLVGHSGVGKSTLVNRLAPDAGRATGTVNQVTGRGRHTSTSVHAIWMTGDGWIIDTPGVRSFGLAHVEPSRVVQAFTDLAPGLAECPRSCTHDEPDCALDAWVATGRAELGRLASLRRILRALG